MTWFKVDDGLHKHRKRVRVGLTLEGFAALGLWTVAGSWSSDELTDGWIPDDVVDYLAPGLGQELAKRLEAAGLWHRGEQRGEEGWQFHEWTGHQPTRESVLRDRAAAALRQQRARDRARERRDDQSADPEPSRRDAGVTDAVVTPAVTVPPTRPDPTSTEHPADVLFGAAQAAPKKQRRAARPATTIPDDFQVTPEMVAWAGENTPLVNGRRETDQFMDYWRQATRNAKKKDWVAAWRTWMRNAQERAERYVSPQDRRNGSAVGYPDRNGVAVRDVQPRQSAGQAKFERAHQIGAELDAEYAGGRR